MESQQTDKTMAGFEEVLFHPAEHLSREIRKATRWWWLYTLFGLASIVLGVAALASRITGVATLVAVFSLFLVYSGVFEIAFATTIRNRRWMGILTGVLSIVAGVVALAWPGITVLVLAIFVGASLLGWGLYRIYLSFTDPLLRPRAVTLVEGVALAALGVLALAWPGVSVLVLSVLVGVFFIAFGIFSFVGGLQLLDLHHALTKAEDEVARTTQGAQGASEVHHHAA